MAQINTATVVRPHFELLADVVRIILQHMPIATYKYLVLYCGVVSRRVFYVFDARIPRFPCAVRFILAIVIPAH